MPADESRPASPLPPVFQPLLPDDPAVVGGYRLFARLGAGGMGRVYLSYTPGGRPVALKVVRPEFAEDPEFRRRFAQEVTNAQRIHGLYTAQVIDSGTDSDSPWLVTAYVPGPSLQQVVREHGALPVRTVLLLMGGIAEALQAIHSVQVVHRDLKPANVLVAGDGPRVIDFGIARAADATALTGTGFRIGSPAFMAPEQAQGRPVTPATDIFALGALAAYVSSGVPPFGEGPETAVLYRVVHEPAELDRVPEDLRELVLRCLAKTPQDRPKPAEIIEIARNHAEVGGQLRFADDWLPSPVNTEITRRADLPKTPPTPLPVPAVTPPPPATAPTLPPPAAPPAAPLSSAPLSSTPPPPTQPPPGYVAPPPGAFGAPQPVTEAPTGPVPGPGPTALLREDPLANTPPPTAFTPYQAPAPPEEPGKPHRRRGVSWQTLLIVSLVVALLCTVGAIVLVKQLDKSSASAASSTPPATSPAPGNAPPATTPAPTSAAPTPTAAGTGSATSTPSTAGSDLVSHTASAASTGGKYTQVYADRVLTSPDYQYAFDLTNGQIIPSNGSASWTLRYDGGSWSWSGTADVYVPTNSQLTPELCATAITQNPTGELHPAQGQVFCVRDRNTGFTILAKVLQLSTTNSSYVQLSITYYRYDS